LRIPPILRTRFAMRSRNARQNRNGVSPCYNANMATRQEVSVDELVEQKLLCGEASTVAEAEELVLDQSWGAVLELLGSPRSNDELGRHPLFTLFRIRGSRPREDSLI
jgi:hypothetical protein